jgi:hypothetical protein
MGSLGLACADAVLDVGLPRPDGAEVGDLSTVVLRDRRDRDRVLMDIPADGERARLVHGCPPRWCGSGVDLRRLWLLVSSPAVQPEVSLPIGSHDVSATCFMPP